MGPSRSSLRFIGIACGVLLLVGACTRGSPGSPSSTALPASSAPASNDVSEVTEPETRATTTTSAVASVDPTEIIVWADEARANVLEDFAASFKDATGVVVQVVDVAFESILEEFLLVGSTAGAPDIIMGASSWAGTLADRDLAMAIDLGGRIDEFSPESVASFSIDGQLYAIPYAVETLAVYFNAALVSGVPATMGELATICADLGGVAGCLGLPGGGTVGDVYHHSPFLTLHGGGVFEYVAATGYVASEVKLDSSETIDGIESLEGLIEQGLIGSVDVDEARARFHAGEVPYWLTGPWELGPLGDTNLDWGVGSIPEVDGAVPRPFVGGQGFYVNAHSEHPVIAQAFLIDFVATDESMQALFRADPRTPAYRTTARAVAADGVQSVFAQMAAIGVPFPNVPEMDVVWQPLADRLLAVRNGELDAASAMAEAQDLVEAALAAGTS